MNKVYTRSQIMERAKIQELRPSEADFVGKKGYRRRYRKDGSYSWRYRFKPNDGHGKATREAQEVGEMLKPHARAASEWQQREQASRPREMLRDRDGSIQYVAPEGAAKTAKDNGWQHAWRVKGEVVGRTIRGVYHRLIDGEWRAA